MKKTFVILILLIIISCVNESSNNESSNNEDNIVIPLDTIDKDVTLITNKQNDTIGIGELWIYLDSAIVISDTISNYDTIAFLRHNTKINFTYKKTEYGLREGFPRGYIEETTFNNDIWFKIKLNNSDYWIKEKDIRYYNFDFAKGDKCVYENENYILEMKEVCEQCECRKQDGIIYNKKTDCFIDRLGIKRLIKAKWLNNDTLIYSASKGTFLYSVKQKHKEKISDLVYFLSNKSHTSIYLLGSYYYAYTDSSKTIFVNYNIKKQEKDSIILTKNYLIVNWEIGYEPDFKINIEDSLFTFNAYLNTKKSSYASGFGPLTAITFDINGKIIKTRKP